MTDLFKPHNNRGKPQKIRTPKVRISSESPPIVYTTKDVLYCENMSKTAISAKDTNTLTLEIIKTLRLRKFFADRMSNEGRVRINEKTGKPYRIKSSLQRGTPDIYAVQKGTAKALYIEVKSEKDTISDWQLYFMKTRQEAGVPCFVAYSYQDFLLKMELLFNLKL